jgi:predicted nucleic acid-binding protein
VLGGETIARSIQPLIPMVFVDTTVWVDYLNGVTTPETDWLDSQLTRQPLGLLDLMICEILQGLSTDEEAARVLRDLRRFQIFETGGLELATEAAKNYRVLRARGRTVRKTIDCLIATFCIREGHSLLHCGRDVEPFEQLLGLAVMHPQIQQPDTPETDAS